jgi:DNA-binding NarL/FixJ family response regulator
MVRQGTGFAERERALLAMVAPALERLLREPPMPALTVPLTTQEQRVLRHVASGMTNAEVAQRLFVAPSTVRKHLENAYRKLGVSNRLAAVSALERARLQGADAGSASRAEIIA